MSSSFRWIVSFPEGGALEPYKSSLASALHYPLDFFMLLLLGQLGKSDHTDSFLLYFGARVHTGWCSEAGAFLFWEILEA